MKRFLIVLMSHCEKVWWDPSYDALRVAVEAMLSLQQRVARRLERPARSTFLSFVDHPDAITAEADAAHVDALFRTALAQGNEVGLHVHAPVGEMATGLQDELIGPDADLLARLGLPRPRTYAAGDWITSPRTVPALEAAGFEVDCSVYLLDGVIEKFGVRLDYTVRPALHPYRPARHNIAADGDSSIVELPVSGALAELGGAVYEGLASLEERVQTRNDDLTLGVDVFQVFWHPFDVVTLNGKNNAELLVSGVEEGEGRGKIGVHRDLLARWERLLLRLGERSDVEITTALDAARLWKAGGKGTYVDRC